MADFTIDTVRAEITGGGSVRVGLDWADLSTNGQNKVSQAVEDLRGEPSALDDPTEADAIRLACYEVEGYESTSSSDLASMIQEKRIAQIDTPRELMEAIIGASTDAATTQDELSELYVSLTTMLEDVRHNVQRRSAKGLKSLSRLFKTAYQRSTGSALSTATKEALEPGIDSVAQSLVEAKADLLGITPPSDVTATDVDNALGR